MIFHHSMIANETQYQIGVQCIVIIKKNLNFLEQNPVYYHLFYGIFFIEISSTVGFIVRVLWFQYSIGDEPAKG